MQNNTANLNIMIKAARKASKSLIRDFNEIEKLQVVSKKAGDFVSKADLRAEKIIKEEKMISLLTLHKQHFQLMILKIL